MLTRAETGYNRHPFRRVLWLALIGTLVLITIQLSVRPTGATAFTAANEAELVIAINAANAAGAGDHEITLSADITLTAQLPTINNPAASSISVEGNDFTLTGDGFHTVLSIAEGTKANVNEITITGGSGSSGIDGNGGGAIFNRGNLSLTDSTITGNSADSGGGILNEATSGTVATTIVIGSTLSNNTAGSGGALANVSTGGTAVADLDQVTITSNVATQHGGALLNVADTDGGEARMSVSRADVTTNEATMTGGAITNQAANGALAKLTILRSGFDTNKTEGSGGGLAVITDSEGESEVFISRAALTNNTAITSGGGIDQHTINGTAEILATNLTVSGNTGGVKGGGIANQTTDGSGRVQLRFTTMADNTATEGNNLYESAPDDSSVISIGSSIIDSAGVNCAKSGGTIDTAGFNISNDATCFLSAATDLSNTSAQLLPLALNAPGNTLTHALPENSPAIDRITVAYLGCDTAVALDQRGAPRRQGIKCDSGAYELDRPALDCALPHQVDSDGELNKAILCVNAAGAGEHTITLIGDFALSGPSNAINNPQATQVIVNGNGHEVNGNGQGTVFSVAADTHVIMSDMAIRNGRGSSGPAGDGGGAIYVRGHLELERATISNSTATSGGGILVDGEAGEASATLIDVTITGNEASRAGGGLSTTGNTGSAIVTIDSSTIENNVSEDTGGGVDLGGYEGTTAVTVTNSTIANNKAKFGGGIFVNGNGTNGIAELNIFSSTVSGNEASDTGGALGVNGNIGQAAANLQNATISRNSAVNSGGAIVNYGNEGTAALTVSYTTFAGNTAPDSGLLQNGVDATALFTASILAGPQDITLCNITGGNVSSGNFNVSRDESCQLTETNDIANGTADLETLTLNAPGDTRTHALGDDSDAINLIPAGSAGCGTTIAEDQRGVMRPVNGRCDSGSYESSKGSTGGPVILFLPMVTSDK